MSNNLASQKRVIVCNYIIITFQIKKFQKQTQSLFGGLRGRRRGKFENSALAQWGKFFTSTQPAYISQFVFEIFFYILNFYDN